MTREIDILVVEPGKAPRPERVADTLETLQQIVGGPVPPSWGAVIPEKSCESAAAPGAGALWR